LVFRGVFVILLTAIRQLSPGDPVIGEHVGWLRRRRAEGRFVFCGRRVGATGGVITAVGDDLGEIQSVLAGDPLARAGLVSYDVLQFDDVQESGLADVLVGPDALTSEGFGPKPIIRGAADLGLDALAAIVENSLDGIVVNRADRRYVYANRAAQLITGWSLDDLLGTDFLENFPAREHQPMLEHVAEQYSGKARYSSSTVVRPDGSERDITFSFMAFDINGSPHGAAILRDVTEWNEASRNACALGQTAAQLAGRVPLTVILDEICRLAVDGTRASGCVVALFDTNHELEIVGTVGDAGSVRDALPNRRWPLGGLADGDSRHAGVTFVPDAAGRWQLREGGDTIARALERLGWHGVVHVPLAWGEETLGLMSVFLPAAVSSPAEGEVLFYRALANQAAVACVNDRLVAETQTASTLRERARLARELHDSVAQTLFSMTLHARAAQLAMLQTGFDPNGPLGRSIAQLRNLTQTAWADMRALIFELRPTALADEGLVAALHTQAAALTARTGLACEIEAPDRLDLPPSVEENLYRIVLEALTNTVRHARARRAIVVIAVVDGRVRVTVSDDGVGFDPAGTAGHFGIATMRERARALGAELEIDAAPARLGSAISVEFQLPDSDV
jgi:PAS domain S-box-containing protein